jgi:hypothetical protein
VEVLAGITLLALVAGSVIFGLNQLNYYAAVNRLYTAAQTLAQNQIDLILTAGPYDPANNKYPSPYNWLRTDVPYYTVIDPAVTPPNPTLTTTATDVPIIIDNANKVVMGKIKTVVTNTGATGTNGASLNLRRATVTVTYTYRNQQFVVSMETMRTSDI